jgi:hypothetical protein
MKTMGGVNAAIEVGKHQSPMKETTCLNSTAEKAENPQDDAS